MDEQPKSAEPAYETRDASLRWTLIFTGIVVGMGVLALLVAAGAFNALALLEDARQREPHPLAARDELSPGPRLEANPPAALAAYLREQRERVESYGWIDPDAGLVRLPVERALELVLEEGLPSREREPEAGSR